MIKNENNFVLLILLILLPNSIKSQSSKQLGFGINLYLLETNIQENIFSKNEAFKSDEFTFGFEAMVIKKLWQNTRIEVGFDYSFFAFTTRKKLEISYGDRDANNEFNLMLNNSNPIAAFSSNIIVFWDDSFCREGESSDSEKIEVRRMYHTRIQTLGIPIRFDYLLGRKPVKIYLNGGISPEIYLSKKLDLGPKRTGAFIDFKRCASNEVGVGYTERYMITSHDENVEKYNVKNISISTEFGIGIAHTLNKSMFRIGVHFGGNTINLVL